MPHSIGRRNGSVVVREDQNLPRIAESVPAVIGLARDPGADELRLAVVFPRAFYALLIPRRRRYGCSRKAHHNHVACRTLIDDKSCGYEFNDLELFRSNGGIPRLLHVRSA